MLRHSLATLAYRLGCALDGAPADFANFRTADAVRTPAETLAHMGDLMDWAAGLSDGLPQWHHSTPLPWDAEIERFHTAPAKVDLCLTAAPLGCDEKRLLQGPIADTLTHTGQSALLRRMHGVPVKPKNYDRAEI